MPTNHWGIQGLDESQFIAANCLLALHGPHQSPRPARIEESDSSDEDIESDDEKARSYETITQNNQDALLRKFLDRIAEIFAREKTIHHAGGRNKRSTPVNGAKHVSASGFVKNAQGFPVVYLTKNDGLDQIDEKMARDLELWMRAIATTLRPPAVDKDRFWTRLLEHSSQRLAFYISELSQADTLSTAYHESFRSVILLCGLYTKLPATETLDRIVSLAYQLRYDQLPGKPGKWIAFLGRIRAAYETFKQASVEFCGAFKNLCITCVPAPPASTIPITHILKNIEQICKDINRDLPTKDEILKLLRLGKRAKQATLPCHAETQLMLYLESSISPEYEIFPYLGCSKRSCYLCYQLLSRYKNKRTGVSGFYKTRGSHGRVYPLWTLCRPIDPWVSFYLSSSLKDMSMDILDKLKTRNSAKGVAVAESTANVTVAGGILRQSELAKRRSKHSETNPSNTDSDKVQLTKYLSSKRCIRIPHNRSETPHYTPIRFYEHPKPWTGPEPVNWTVPDFSPYWGAHNLERHMRCVSIKNESPPPIDGTYYLFYWCTATDLPENENILDMLGLESVGFDRRFWHGDVFIVRCYENQETFTFRNDDVPEHLLARSEVKSHFINFWENKEIERQIEEDSIWNVREEKLEADKEILLSRMSPSEREAIKEQPNILEYLAITDCDDDALVHIDACEAPDKPGYVALNSIHRRRNLDNMGWTGFTSDHL